MTRREFVLGSAALAAAGSRERVRMGFIGVGNRGTQLLHIFMKNPKVEVVALCDIYEPFLRRDFDAFDPKFLEWGLRGRIPSLRNRTGEVKPQEARLAEMIKAGKIALYKDYKALLADPNVDAVCIATPDFAHFPAAMLAMSMGKAVYCEKPMGNCFREISLMMAAAKKSRTLMG